MTRTNPIPPRRAANLYPDTRRPGERVKSLGALDWWMKVGSDEAARVAHDAGTSFEHFKHIAHGRRRPSVAMAERLSAASNGGMSVVRLLGISPNPVTGTRAKPPQNVAE